MSCSDQLMFQDTEYISSQNRASSKQGSQQFLSQDYRDYQKLVCNAFIMVSTIQKPYRKDTSFYQYFYISQIFVFQTFACLLVISDKRIVACILFRAKEKWHFTIRIVLLNLDFHHRQSLISLQDPLKLFAHWMSVVQLKS